MAPFSSTRVIPEGWDTHHRPVAAGTMTAEAVVYRPGGPEPFPPDPAWDPSGELLWTGKCRLQELKQETTAVPTDQPTYGRSYLVTFPYSAENPVPKFNVGERGDTVTINGTVLILQHPMAGSLLWEHDYIAWANHTQERIQP